jgi:hypothetical protein
MSEEQRPHQPLVGYSLIAVLHLTGERSTT